MVALGTFDLQTSYLASPAGGPHIELDKTQEAFCIDGANLDAGAPGTDGPDYFQNTRGAVKILNIAYNSTDLQTTIYSTAVNGVEFRSAGELLLTAPQVRMTAELEIDGTLDHDGANAGFFGAAPVAQPVHIVDADGTLADITTKFNTLLGQVAALGLQAASQ